MRDALLVALLVAGPMAVAPATAEGQLPPASPASAALGDHDVAVVRGFGAVGVNPAGLGLGDTARTFAVLPLRAGTGMDPVSLGDVGRWQGRPVPDAVRDGWLRRIVEAGRQGGVVFLGVTPLALSRRGTGFQISTVAAGRISLNPDAAELLLFGNAGRTGAPRGYDLGGSRVDGWVASTLAVAHGAPVATVAGGRLAVGATLKLALGHAVVVGRDLGTSLGGDPLEGDVHFPVVTRPSGDRDLRVGSGVGLDAGAAWEGRRLALGVAFRNLAARFDWDLADLTFRPGTLLFDQQDATSDFDERPATLAPGHLREAVAGLGFGRAVEVGAGWRVAPDLLLAASTERRWGDAPVPAWRTRAGAGVEWAPREETPLRAHLGVAGGSVELGGGGSVRLGPAWITIAGAVRPGGADADASAAFGVSWGGR